MTTITIQNFRGIDASFELGEPLTLICGANGAGKTRVAQALGAALASYALPLTGKAQDKKEILGEGADKAMIRLSTGDALRAIVWPSGETSTKGDQAGLPTASIYAAGLVSILDLSGKERAQAFQNVFKIEPSKMDLAKALEKRDLSSWIERIWDQIDISGWDAATTQAATTAREFKGRWGEVTGATWGEKVGETWEPDATKFPDEAELQKQVYAAEDNLKHAQQVLEAAKQNRAQLPEPLESQKAYACAHCGQMNVIEFGKLVKAENAHQLNSDALKEARLAIASAEGKVANAQDQVYHHQREVGAARTRLSDAAEAKSKATARAFELHQHIMEQLEIAAVCGPNGLRKAKLEHVLGKLNESFESLAKEIKLPLVELDAELEVAMDGTPLRRLSRAEQWICRTIMQLEIARRDDSTMVVIDDLDVPIDPTDRNRVLQALYASGLKAAVMLAARSPESRYAPDLSTAGIGVTYWIDRVHGLRPIGEAQDQKAA